MKIKYILIASLLVVGANLFAAEVAERCCVKRRTSLPLLQGDVSVGAHQFKKSEKVEGNQQSDWLNHYIQEDVSQKLKILQSRPSLLSSSLNDYGMDRRQLLMHKAKEIQGFRFS